MDVTLTVYLLGQLNASGDHLASTENPFEERKTKSDWRVLPPTDAQGRPDGLRAKGELPFKQLNSWRLRFYVLY